MFTCMQTRLSSVQQTLIELLNYAKNSAELWGHQGEDEKVLDLQSLLYGRDKNKKTKYAIPIQWHKLCPRRYRSTEEVGVLLGGFCHTQCLG